jgi:hypothetical protein
LGGGRALPRCSPRLPEWAAKEPKVNFLQLGYFVYFDEDGHAYWEYGNKECIVVKGLSLNGVHGLFTGAAHCAVR